VNGGIRGLHHGAINAVDWEASLAFYRDTLGLELLGSGEASGDIMETALGRPGVRLRWAMFAVGDAHFELIGYVDPPAGRVTGHPWDGGATHLAFKVDDVDEAYRDLSARGVHFLGEPVRYAEPVPVGGAFAYALDPSGVVLEFIEDVAER
jgi:catechol 2,3-dioxygenase-like lactoylglutathione lyase family enzyme